MSGQNRGVVIEVQYQSDGVGDGPKSLNNDEAKKYELLFRSLLKGLFGKLTGKLDLRLDDMKMHITQLDTTENHNEKDGTTVSNTNTKGSRQNAGSPAGSKIAELYMEVLRGSRS